MHVCIKSIWYEDEVTTRTQSQNGNILKELNEMCWSQLSGNAQRYDIILYPAWQRQTTISPRTWFPSNQLFRAHISVFSWSSSNTAFISNQLFNGVIPPLSVRHTDAERWGIQSAGQPGSCQSAAMLFQWCLCLLQEGVLPLIGVAAPRQTLHLH